MEQDRHRGLDVCEVSTRVGTGGCTTAGVVVDGTVWWWWWWGGQGSLEAGCTGGVCGVTHQQTQAVFPVLPVYSRHTLPSSQALPPSSSAGLNGRVTGLGEQVHSVHTRTHGRTHAAPPGGGRWTTTPLQHQCAFNTQHSLRIPVLLLFLREPPVRAVLGSTVGGGALTSSSRCQLTQPPAVRAVRAAA